MADTQINILSTNQNTPATRDRGKVNVQNVGTALCGVHIGDTQPTALDQCEVLLNPATAVDKGDGAFVEINARGPLWIYFDSTGTKKCKVSPEL